MQYADNTQLFSMLNFLSLLQAILTLGEFEDYFWQIRNYLIRFSKKKDDFIETDPSLHWAKKPLNVLGVLGEGRGLTKACDITIQRYRNSQQK